MVTAVKSVFSKYATFGGRATRSEFWYFYLFLIIVGLILYGIDSVTSLNFGPGTVTFNDKIYDAPGIGILSSIFTLVTIIPFLAVGCRRLHDSGKTGNLQWLFLLFWIPCLGLILFIAFIVFWAKASDPGDNKYGPKPA